MPFTLTMPKLSPTMESGTIVKWRIKEGTYVKAGDVLFEIATDKATVEHSAIDAGWLRKIVVPEGGEARVNQAVAIFTEKKEESIEGYQLEEEAAAPLPSLKAQSAKVQLSMPLAPLAKGQTPASPLARKLAKERGIDLSSVRGTGPGRRVMSRDLELAGYIFGAAIQEEKLTPIRKIIANRMQASKASIPHFYATQEVRSEKLFDAREKLKAKGEAVSINDFIIRASAFSLKEHPEMNSGFDPVKQMILRFKTIDISVAVSLNDGLVTPIIRGADSKSLAQIAAEMKELAQKAREGKLQPAEYMGGSFTISNLGMYGISEFIAVINPPQAAILAVGAIEDKPVIEGGQVVPGKVLRLTLSGDHRVIDGAAAAKFLKTLQNLLENPNFLNS